MAGVARLSDSTIGTTTGEHGGHYVEGVPVHSASTLTGTISGGCSSNVFVNGRAVAVIGATVSESDNCTGGTGTLTIGSSRVFVNGKAVVRNGDSYSPHNGSAHVSSGSSNVNVG